MRAFAAAALLFAFAILSASAANDGLALTPPMGFRDWNQWQCKITQQDMEGIMDKVADTSRGVSLAALGYSDVGLGALARAAGGCGFRYSTSRRSFLHARTRRRLLAKVRKVWA
jgi:hypothetical protein